MKNYSYPKRDNKANYAATIKIVIYASEHNLTEWTIFRHLMPTMQHQSPKSHLTVSKEKDYTSSVESLKDLVIF